MKIFEKNLTNLAERGQLTLQVTEYRYLMEGSARSLGAEVEVPDDWFMRVKYQGSHPRFSVGNESGALHFSPKGYEANKAKLKAAFEASGTQRGAWADFEDHAKKFFEEVAANTVMHRDRLQKKAYDADAAAKLILAQVAQIEA